MSVPEPSSAPSLPPSPRLVLGRDELLDQLCSKLLQSPAPAIALLGPGGIGKSTLTLRALHRPEVVARFGARRWFVRLDTAPTAEAALGLLNAVLGLPPSGQPLPTVRAFLEQSPGLLVLDNLETPWEVEPQETEELLQALRVAPDLALVISLRGGQSPDDLDVEAIEVPSLDKAAATKLFCRISRKAPDDPSLASLLTLLDGVPLAIRLLARVAQGGDLASLLTEWREKRTTLLARDDTKPDRETSWETSMALSVGSRRMTPEAKRLMALLGRLPDGVASDDLDALLPQKGREAGRKLIYVGLAYHDRGRLRVLTPVREYALAKLKPEPGDLAAARDHYGNLATTLGPCAGGKGGAEAIERLAPETANLDAMIREGLAGAEPAPWISASMALTDFSRFSGHSSPSPLEAALEAAQSVGEKEQQAMCLSSLGNVVLDRSDHGKARRCYEQALPLYRQVGSVLGEAGCIERLGDVALRRREHDEARRCYEQALRLHRQVGSVLGEANCIQSLGDIALERSGPAAAKGHYQAALSLYTRLPSPYSMGFTHRRLAWLANDDTERQSHIDAARKLWTKIARPDLVARLDAKFAPHSSVIDTEPNHPSIRASQGVPETNGEVQAERHSGGVPSGEIAPTVASGKQTRVFVSCSRSEADAVYLTELETHLVPFERSAAIKAWHRGRALAGADVTSEVGNQCEAANLVLLLVSPDFMASDDCRGDMGRALRRREDSGGQGVTVVPILIRPVALLPEPLSALQPLPRGGEAVSQWPARDDAWVNVIRGLQPLLNGRGTGES